MHVLTNKLLLDCTWEALIILIDHMELLYYSGHVIFDDEHKRPVCVF